MIVIGALVGEPLYTEPYVRWREISRKVPPTSFRSNQVPDNQPQMFVKTAPDTAEAAFSLNIDPNNNPNPIKIREPTHINEIVGTIDQVISSPRITVKQTILCNSAIGSSGNV